LGLVAGADSAPDEDSFESEPPSLLEPVESPEEEALAPDFDREPLELERSFLAQPEPLKWTAGVANDFRSVPSAPQTGQKRGPGASMPWMTSVVCPQFEQT